ncbi:MAG: cytochrome c3 family protein [Desulfovibrio sp.]|jgi:hypothetical protein|nr:cytochrome c3 family protein [Desulfovibrio sp.]
MKYLIILLLAAACIWTGDLRAGEPKKMGAIKNKPIVIEGGSSKRMTVVFSHRSHRDIGCIHCHHETSSDVPFSSCREDCHAEPGARERDPMSMFMAFHSKASDRSCLGCHSKLAAEVPSKYPALQGCRPCHRSGQARQTAAAEGGAQ